MSVKPRYRSILLYVVMSVVLVCALGQLFNWSPIGVGAMVRSGLSVVGIAGAILLMCRYRVGWALLLPWALIQTKVYQRDLSGPWFNQSLKLEWTNSSWTKAGYQIVDISSDGVNYAGLIWFCVFLLVIGFKLFGPLKPLSLCLRPTRGRLIVASVLLLVLSGYVGYLITLHRQAFFIIHSEYPGTAIYYQDKLLGHTPLAVTASRIKAWGLPLKTDQALKYERTGWIERMLVYSEDKKSEVTLDARAPFYAPESKMVQTPWGPRNCIWQKNIKPGSKDFNLVMYKLPLDAAPNFTLELLEPPPYYPGQKVAVKFEMYNPVKSITGDSPEIKLMYTSFNGKWVTAPSTGSFYGPSPNKFAMSERWNEWPGGVRLEETVKMTMPSKPGQYTLFAMFTLYHMESLNKGALGAPYTNYVYLEVSEPPASDALVEGDEHLSHMSTESH